MSDEEKKPEQLTQDIHGSRIVRTLTLQGWETYLFCPWPEATEGVKCVDLAEAIQLAKAAKIERGESETPRERTKPETVTAGTLAEGLEEVIERVIEEETA